MKRAPITTVTGALCNLPYQQPEASNDVDPVLHLIRYKPRGYKPRGKHIDRVLIATAPSFCSLRQMRTRRFVGFGGN